MNKTILTIIAAALLPMAAFAAPLGSNNDAPINGMHFEVASAEPTVVLARHDAQPQRGAAAVCYGAVAFVSGSQARGG
jgi:hypothetical protein